MTAATTTLEFRDLGLLGYDDALQYQQALVTQRLSGRVGDTILFVEHPPTITLGRAANRANLLLSEAELARRGVAVRESDRGGDVTYHGPGQLVGYPIVDLTGRGRDLHRYLRDIEGVLISALEELGIEAGRVPGLTGVWVGPRKIAAIGIKVSRWVTSHGFALNVGPDLSGFSFIVPCGIRDRGVTSISRELGQRIPVDEVKPIVRRELEHTFGATS
ncbi:MAG: octanoyltransferase [Dehalococcoidia bacterium]|nr:MAG: octanoyltransferase [Dehalococcoidia bacterium]